jgi:hypothetical protein
LYFLIFFIFYKDNECNDKQRQQQQIHDSISKLNPYELDAQKFLNLNSRNFCQNFEIFCIRFLNTFIFNGDLLSIFIPKLKKQLQKQQNNIDLNNNNSKHPKNSKSQSHIDSNIQLVPILSPLDGVVVDEIYFLIEIGWYFYKLSHIILTTGSHRYNKSFQKRIYDLFRLYVDTLTKHLLEISQSNLKDEMDNLSLNDKIKKYQKSLTELQEKCEDLNFEKKVVMKLSDLCRIRIDASIWNHCNNQKTLETLINCSCSALSNDYAYFKLPQKYSKQINYLTHYLIDDLYGENFDIKTTDFNL